MNEKAKSNEYLLVRYDGGYLESRMGECTERTYTAAFGGADL